MYESRNHSSAAPDYFRAKMRIIVQHRQLFTIRRLSDRYCRYDIDLCYVLWMWFLLLGGKITSVGRLRPTSFLSQLGKHFAQNTYKNVRKSVLLPFFKAKNSIEQEDVHRGTFISAPLRHQQWKLLLRRKRQRGIGKRMERKSILLTVFLSCFIVF